MQSLRNLTLAAATLAVFAVPAAAQTLPPARQVVDRYVEAIGGRAAAQRFQSRSLVYEISASGMTMNLEVKMRRPNLGSVVMATPMGEIRSGSNGDVVWAIGPMGAQILEGAQAEEMRIRSAFDADVLFDVYPTMETTERAEYGGKACWKVRMVTAAGMESFRCFDVDSGLMVAATQNQNGMLVTAVFDQYIEQDGLKYPSHSVASAMGQEVVTTLKSVSHAELPMSVFDLPESVRALQQ